MKRLGWAELFCLGVLAILALNIGARYGWLPALLALFVLVATGRMFIADAQVDEALDRLDGVHQEHVIDGHIGGRRG